MPPRAAGRCERASGGRLGVGVGEGVEGGMGKNPRLTYLGIGGHTVGNRFARAGGAGLGGPMGPVKEFEAQIRFLSLL